MKTWASTILSVASAFVVTLVLQSAVFYVTQPKGTAMIGPTIGLQGQTYVSVDITNYTAEPLSKVMLSIPKSTNITETLSSNPIEIIPLADVAGTDSRKRVSLNNLEPSRVTKLLIPIANPSDLGLVQMLNDKQLGISIQAPSAIQNPFLDLVTRNIPMMIVYTLMYAVFAFWTFAENQHRREEFKQEREESNKEAERLRTVQKEWVDHLERQNTKLLQDSSRLHKSAIETRAILIRRVADYSKELDFWRDTIRKLLYQFGQDETSATKIFEAVTESLKTYHTRDQHLDWETLDALANPFSESRGQSQEPQPLSHKHDTNGAS